MKKQIFEARSSLHTVDEYVNKIKNRVDYLAQSESRMQQKIDRMQELMAKREQVILNKWKEKTEQQKKIL